MIEKIQLTFVTLFTSISYKQHSIESLKIVQLSMLFWPWGGFTFFGSDDNVRYVIHFISFFGGCECEAQDSQKSEPNH